jgi:hypothetical protein
MRAIHQQMLRKAFSLCRDLSGSSSRLNLHDVVRSPCEEGGNTGARYGPLCGLGV